MAMEGIIGFIKYKCLGFRFMKLFDDTDELRRVIPMGKAIRMEIPAGKEICITRDQKMVRAFYNRCPHQGLPMHQGSCENGSFVCPFHRHSFELSTGKNKTFIQPERLKFLPLIKLRQGIYCAIAKD